MINEAMCKVVCHNLCCLIQSVQELGVTASFWQKDDPKVAPAPYDVVEAMAWM
jgi:hypothetical protein